MILYNSTKSQVSLDFSSLQEQTANFSIRGSGVTLVNCLSAAITVTAPTNVEKGDRFALIDSRANSSNNNIVVDFTSNDGGFPLFGSFQNYTINEDGAYVEFCFVNETVGWIAAKGSIMLDIQPEPSEQVVEEAP